MIKNKFLLIGIIATVVLGIGYLLYQSGGSDFEAGEVGSLLKTVEVEESDVLSIEIKRAISQIDSLQLDTKLFQSSAYQSLVDRSEKIPAEPVGRPNPFAPIGQDGSGIDRFLGKTTDDDLSE